MISKCVVIFLILQVVAFEQSVGRHLSLLHLNDNLSVKPSRLDFSKSGFKRGRRCLGGAISLLWPQVVGPVEQGVIEESDFDAIPKTPLEYRLDILRKRAAEEEYDRLVIRDYLKKLTEAQDEFYGYSYGNSLMNNYT